MNLQTKVILPIALLVALLMAISGTLSYFSAKDSLTTSLVDNMRGEAVSLTRNLSILLTSAQQDAERTTIRSDVINFFHGDTTDPDNQKNLSRVLEAVMQSYPNFDNMSVSDLNGMVLASADPALIGQNLSSRDYIQGVRQAQKPFITAPFSNESTKSTAIISAVPIMIDNKAVGILIGNINLRQFFHTFVEPVSIAHHGYAMILSSDGLPAIHKDASHELNSSLPDSAAFRQLAQMSDGFHNFTASTGETVLVYLKKDPASGMTVVIRADEDDVLAPLKKIRTQTYAVTAIGVLLGILLLFMIIRPIISAIKRGAAFADDIAKGNLESQFNVKRKDELGALANSLRAIPAVLKEIMAIYEQLEKNVEDGLLDTQADASQFSGEYADLIQGTNAIMNRYRMVLDYIPSPVVVLSKDAKATFINTQAQDLAGTDYKGKTCKELFARDDYWTDTCALRKTYETGRAASSETRAHPRGKDMDIAYSSIPMLADDGKIASVLQLLTDLTALKSTQRIMEDIANHALDISNRVAAASEQLSAQVEEVTRGADLQRDRAGSTATGMEEMNATVLEVARNAGDASHQTETTRARAASGAQLVEQVISTMNGVNTITQELQKNIEALGVQAEAIGGVMNVISDIADQTNLLALNAAIEAARAGEAGRGFAVVADSVRQLAEKTMTATSEVGANIRGIQSSTQASARRFTDAAAAVAEATNLAGTSGEALHEILELANKSAELVSSIATAAEEQSATSEEINRSVEEINRIAEETAAGMAESSSAVHEIANMSQELKSLLDRLKS